MKELVHKEPVLQEAWEVLERCNQDPELRKYAAAAEKRYRDAVWRLSSARREGEERGRQAGLQEGMQQGVQQGLQQLLAAAKEKGLPFADDLRRLIAEMSK